MHHYIEEQRDASELWRARATARDSLAAERVRTGLRDAESAAAAESTAHGQNLYTKGSSFEDACMSAMQDIWLGDAEGRVGAGAPATAEVAPPGSKTLVLQNVTLGVAAGEIDMMVVRVHDLDAALVASPPKHGDGVGDNQEVRGEGEGLPAVEVLAVVECKRSADDVARGFHQRQAMLAWLTGTSWKYDPGGWKNKRHPTGHFRCGYHALPKAARQQLHLEDGKKASLALTPQSFRRFRPGMSGRAHSWFIEGVWFATRPRSLTGLDAKLRAPLLEMAVGLVVDRLASEPAARVTRRACVGGTADRPGCSGVGRGAGAGAGGAYAEERQNAVDVAGGSVDPGHASSAAAREDTWAAVLNERRDGGGDEILRGSLATLHGWVGRALEDFEPATTQGVLSLYADHEHTAEQILLVDV